ncbi:hypothetical protein MKX03_013578 [Papaver bracteatum]|nr:hypothetical protein MKX03_013578 [Papaver bracteatum]
MDMKLKPAITVLLLGLLLVIYVPHSSVAASGGVIGGDTFSSHSSSNDHSHSFSMMTDSVPYFRYDDANVAGSGAGGGGESGDGGGSPVGGVIMVLFVAFIFWIIIRSNSNRRGIITVIKLQVDAELGIEDGEKRFKQLSKEEREKFDEETLLNLNNIKRQSFQSITVDNMEGIDDGEKNFNELSKAEQENLDREPLVSVNSIKRQTTSSKSSLSNEYIVVTILVAAEGVNKQPRVDCSGNLKVALQKLGSIPTNNIKAVQVLWTPQLEKETLTQRELLEDYPLLKPL